MQSIVELKAAAYDLIAEIEMVTMRSNRQLEILRKELAEVNQKIATYKEQKVEE